MINGSTQWTELIRFEPGDDLEIGRGGWIPSTSAKRIGKLQSLILLSIIIAQWTLAGNYSIIIIGALGR